MELRSLENVRECVKGGLDKGPTQSRFYFLDFLMNEKDGNVGGQQLYGY